MELVPEMLDILACPKCKGALQYAGDSLVCAACRLRYPIRQGLPVLIVEEAEQLSEE
ncbi:MAG: Trm112 family protein [Geobacteraceae bacterium]